MYRPQDLFGTAARSEDGDGDCRVDVPRNAVAPGGFTGKVSPRCRSIPVEVLDNGYKHDLVDRFSNLMQQRSELHTHIQRRLSTWNSEDVAKKTSAGSIATPLHAPSASVSTAASKCPSFITHRNTVPISLPLSSMQRTVNVVPQKVFKPVVSDSVTPRIIPQQTPPVALLSTPRITSQQMPTSAFSSAPRRLSQQIPLSSQQVSLSSQYSSASSKNHQQVPHHKAVSSSPRRTVRPVPTCSTLSWSTPLVTPRQPHPQTIPSMPQFKHQDSPSLSVLSSTMPGAVSHRSPSSTLSSTVPSSPLVLSSFTAQTSPPQLPLPPSLPSMPLPSTAVRVLSSPPKMLPPEPSSPARMSPRTSLRSPPFVPVHAPRFHASPRDAIPPRNSPISCCATSETQENSTHVLPQSSCVALTRPASALTCDAVGEARAKEDIPPISRTYAKSIVSKYERALQLKRVPGDAHSDSSSSVLCLSPSKGRDALATHRSDNVSVYSFSEEKSFCVAITELATGSRGDAVGEVAAKVDIPPTSPTPPKPLLSKYKRPLRSEHVPGDARLDSSFRRLSFNKGHDSLATHRKGNVSVCTFSDEELSWEDRTGRISVRDFTRGRSNSSVDLKVELDEAVSVSAVQRRNKVRNAVCLIGGDWRWQRNKEEEEEGGAAESLGDDSHTNKEHGCRADQQREQYAGHDLTTGTNGGHKLLIARCSRASENFSTPPDGSPASAVRAKSLSTHSAFKDSPTLVHRTTKRADSTRVSVQEAKVLQQRARLGCARDRLSSSSSEAEFDQLFFSVENDQKAVYSPEGRRNATRKINSRVSVQNDATHTGNAWETFATIGRPSVATKYLWRETKPDKERDDSDASRCELPWCDRQQRTPSPGSSQNAWDDGYKNPVALQSMCGNNSDELTIYAKQVCSEQDASMKATALANNAAGATLPTRSAPPRLQFQQKWRYAQYAGSFTKNSEEHGEQEPRSEARDDINNTKLPTTTSSQTTRKRTEVPPLTNPDGYAWVKQETTMTDVYPREYCAIDIRENIDVRNDSAEHEMSQGTSRVWNDQRERLVDSGMIVVEDDVVQGSSRAWCADDPAHVGYTESTAQVIADRILEGKRDGMVVWHSESERQMGVVKSNENMGRYRVPKSKHSAPFRKEPVEWPTMSLVRADITGNNDACDDNNHSLLPDPLSRFASPDASSSALYKRSVHGKATEGSDAYIGPPTESILQNQRRTCENPVDGDEPDSAIGVHASNAANAFGVVRAPELQARTEFKSDDFAVDSANKHASDEKKLGASCVNQSAQNFNESTYPIHDVTKRVATSLDLRAVHQTVRSQFYDNIGAPLKYDEIEATMLCDLPEPQDVSLETTIVESREGEATGAHRKRLVWSRNDEWDLDCEEYACAASASNDYEQEVRDQSNLARSGHSEQDSKCGERADVTDATISSALVCDSCDPLVSNAKNVCPTPDLPCMTRPAQQDKGQWVRKKSSNANLRPPQCGSDPVARHGDSNTQQHIDARGPVNEDDCRTGGNERWGKNALNRYADSADLIARRSCANGEGNCGDDLASKEIRNTIEQTHEKHACDVFAGPPLTRHNKSKTTGSAHLDQHDPWSETYGSTIVENVDIVGEAISQETYNRHEIAEKDSPCDKIPHTSTLVSSASSAYSDVMLSTATLLTHVESTPSMATSGHESCVLLAPSTHADGAPSVPSPGKTQHMTNTVQHALRSNTAAPMERALPLHSGFSCTTRPQMHTFHAHPPPAADDKSSKEWEDTSPSSLPAHSEFLMDTTDPKYRGIFLDSPDTPHDHQRIFSSSPTTENAVARSSVPHMCASLGVKGNDIPIVCPASAVALTVKEQLRDWEKLEEAAHATRIRSATCIQQWWRQHLDVQRWREGKKRFSQVCALSPKMENWKTTHVLEVGNRNGPIGTLGKTNHADTLSEKVYMKDSNDDTASSCVISAQPAHIVSSGHRPLANCAKDSVDVRDSQADYSARERFLDTNDIDDKRLSDWDPACESHFRPKDCARSQGRLQQESGSKQLRYINEVRVPCLRDASSQYLQPTRLRDANGANEASPRYFVRNGQRNLNTVDENADTNKFSLDDSRGYVGIRAPPIGTSAEAQSTLWEGCNKHHNFHKVGTSNVNLSQNINRNIADDVLSSNVQYAATSAPHNCVRPTQASSQTFLNGDVAPGAAERKSCGASPSRSWFPDMDIRSAPTLPILEFPFTDVAVSNALLDAGPSWGQARPNTNDACGLSKSQVPEIETPFCQSLEGLRQRESNILLSQGSADRTRAPTRDDLSSISCNIADDRDRSGALSCEDDGSRLRLDAAISNQCDTAKRTRDPDDVEPMRGCNAGDDVDTRVHQHCIVDGGIHHQSHPVYGVPQHSPKCLSETSFSAHNAHANGAEPANRCYSVPPSSCDETAVVGREERSSQKRPTASRQACAQYDGTDGTRLTELLAAAVRGYITRCNLFDSRAIIQEHFDVCQLILDAADARDAFVENLVRERRRLRISIKECVRRPFQRPRWGRRDVVKFKGWASADFQAMAKKDESNAVLSGTTDDSGTATCSPPAIQSTRTSRPFLRRTSTRIMANETQKAELRKAGTRVECWGHKAQPKRACNIPISRMDSFQDEPTTRTKSLERTRPRGTRTHHGAPSEHVRTRAKSRSPRRQVAGNRGMTQAKAKAATKAINVETTSKAASHAKSSVLPVLWRFLEKVHGDAVGLEADAFFGPPRSTLSLSKDSALMKQWMSMSDDELVAETRKMKATYHRLCDNRY